MQIRETIGRYDETKIHPAIFRLKINGIRDEDRHMENWGWVKLPQLNDCLMDIFRSGGLSVQDIMEDVFEIFRRYGLLCNREGDKPLFTWVSYRSYAIDSESLPPVGLDTCIPAGWAKRILRLVEKDNKILRVTSSPHVWHEEKGPQRGGLFMKMPAPYLGPFMRHQLIGHPQNGHPWVLCFNGEGGSTTKEAPGLMCMD
jgi:hypothetical protein